MKEKNRKRKTYFVISSKEWINIIIKTLCLIAMLDYVFYKNVSAVFFLLIPGLIYLKKEYDGLLMRKRNAMTLQFKEFLMITTSGLRAGYSVENAMQNSLKDLAQLFGKNAPVCSLINTIRIAKKNNRPIADVFIEAGREMKIKDIEDFGLIYRIAYSGSGNMSYVMDKTAITIAEKIDSLNEIYMMINEKAFEAKLMNLMPFMIITYISLTNPGYFDVMYQELTGRIIMTILMFVYMSAYLWGERIMDIRV